MGFCSEKEAVAPERDSPTDRLLQGGFFSLPDPTQSMLGTILWRGVAQVWSLSGLLFWDFWVN